MMGRLMRKWRRLRAMPRDLFASLSELKVAVERQNNGLDLEVRSLNEQLPQINDALLQLLLRVRAAEEARLAAPAGAVALFAPGEPAEAVIPDCVMQRLTAWREEDRGLILGRLESALQTRHDQDRAIARQLEALVQAQQDSRWVMASDRWTPEIGDRVRRTLAALRPFQVGNAAKTRLGRANDGGYVVINDFAGVDGVLSLGVGRDTSWDLALAERGLTVRQYDDTGNARSQPHPSLAFHRVRIAPEDGANAVSIQTVLGERRAAGDRRLILKLALDGDEWDCLDALDADLLQSCSQIVVAFHYLHRLAEQEFSDVAYRCFSKLSAGFFVCHVHGNNFGHLYNVGNVTVPDTLEVTFANRACYQPIDSPEIFPTPIDMPNQPGRADIFLGTFRFAG
jgi:hypothetical protein